jgi:2-polyprenyl-3-methyl-5-hydroxy-6-metoxy-1,4-benzoquinol methylase
MLDKACPVCKSVMTAGNEPWHFVCKRCHYEMATLLPTINKTDLHRPLDEFSRESGLRTVRNINFKTLLNRICTFTSNHHKLLDVGCAHGWFLELAKNRFDVLGIEPDQTIFKQTLKLGLPIRMGYFPQILSTDEKFDVIVFNDVIEHIPDIQSVLSACNDHLKDDGLLVLNLPDSNGVFYRLSKIFNFIGMKGFFERMWQVGMPSPHIHYFNQKNLGILLASQGFEVKDKGRLETLSLDGLYTRLTYANKKTRPIVTSIIYCLILIAMPLLKILPSDIAYVITQKKK